jgi:hypothetical protein
MEGVHTKADLRDVRMDYKCCFKEREGGLKKDPV